MILGNGFSRRIDPSWVLATVCLAVPPVSLIAALAVAPLAGLAAVALLAAGGWHRPRLVVGWPMAGLLAAFLLWCLVSLTWSLEPAIGLRGVAMLAGVVLSGLVITGEAARLDDPGRLRVGKALVAGLVLALAGLLVAIIAARLALIPSASVTRFDRGSTVIAMLIWPALAALRRMGAGKAGWALFALALVTVGATHDLAAKMALVSGGAIFLLARLAPRQTVIGLAGLLAVFQLTVPLAATALPSPEVASQWEVLPISAHHRMTIWSFVGAHVLDHPWAGWGFESARSLPGGKDEFVFTRNGAEIHEPHLPLHPHDASLQIWLELGAVGAVLWAVLIGLVGRAIGRGDDRAAGAAALIAGFAISAVSYGAWQSWWLLTLWLTAGLMAALSAKSVPHAE